MKTSLAKDDLWFGVHSAVLQRKFDEAWRLCTGVNSEEHPMFLYLLNLVCRTALARGHSSAEHWCEEVQQLFVDLKCPALLRDAVARQSDAMLTGARNHFDRCFRPAKSTPHPSPLDSARLNLANADETTAAEVETPKENEGSNSPNTTGDESAQAMRTDAFAAITGFLLPVVDAVVNIELLEHLDPVTSDLARASFPCSPHQQLEYVVDEVAVERSAALTSVCDELLAQEASQLCALAEFELMRAQHMLLKCQQVFSTASMWRRGAWGQGPLLPSKLFLSTVLQLGGSGGGGSHIPVRAFADRVGRVV
jgi:hypothetical protein